MHNADDVDMTQCSHMVSIIVSSSSTRSLARSRPLLCRALAHVNKGAPRQAN